MLITPIRVLITLYILSPMILQVRVGARLFGSGPGALCVGARPSVSGPGAGPALFVSGPGPGALCVGARRSFYRRAPAISVRVCLEPALFLDWSSPGVFVSGHGALCRRVRAVRQAPALCVGPRAPACHPSGPQLSPSTDPSSDPRATRPVCLPPIQHRRPRSVSRAPTFDRVPPSSAAMSWRPGSRVIRH